MPISWERGAGQGMGDRDIAAAWPNGKVCFKVPESVKLNFIGKLPEHISKGFRIKFITSFWRQSIISKVGRIVWRLHRYFSLDQALPLLLWLRKWSHL